MEILNEKPLTRDELLKELKDLSGHYDAEVAHASADDLLLKFINDEEITAAFENIERWYA